MLKLSEIDVAILCGGLGKRLRTETKGGQKTMVSVDDQPFLDILLKYLSNQGFTRAVLCTGYHAEDVEEYYAKKDLGIEIAFSREKEPLGTGGAVKNAAKVIKSDSFFVLNGDCFCALKYQGFVDFHFEKGSMLSLVLSRLEDRKDFGTINVDDDGNILSFREKIEAVDPDEEVYVNTGIYCFNKEAVSFMPEEDRFSLELDYFPKVIGKKFYGYRTDDQFIDIGTPDRLKIAQEFLRKVE